MTRVSDNSGKFALNFALSKAKKKLEDLQLKGSSLKNFTRPSENPVANINYLQISGRMSDNKQFLSNITYAKTQLDYTEKAIEELTDIMVKAKEMAIAQSSDFYNENVKKNVSREVMQLKNQALAIANRRLGNKYIFAGFKTSTRPFDDDGAYRGDIGRVSLEVSKDFFIPTNLNGIEVFFSGAGTKDTQVSPLAPFPRMQIDQKTNDHIYDKSRVIGGRNLASVTDTSDKNLEAIYQQELKGTHRRNNIFTQLHTFVNALENNQSNVIQDLLPKIDNSIDRLINMRTRIGALQRSLDDSENNIEKQDVSNASQKSAMADADVAELYTELAKQQNLLQATYKSGQGTLNKSLLDFLR